MDPVPCERSAHWRLHDIAIANIAWSMAYTRGSGGGSHTTHYSCNGIAIA